MRSFGPPSIDAQRRQGHDPIEAFFTIGPFGPRVNPALPRGLVFGSLGVAWAGTGRCWHRVLRVGNPWPEMACDAGVDGDWSAPV